MSPEYKSGYNQAIADMKREIKAQIHRATGSPSEHAFRWLLTMVRDLQGKMRNRD